MNSDGGGGGKGGIVYSFSCASSSSSRRVPEIASKGFAGMAAGRQAGQGRCSRILPPSLRAEELGYDRLTNGKKCFSFLIKIDMGNEEEMHRSQAAQEVVEFTKQSCLI